MMKYSKRSFHFAWISVVLILVFVILSQWPRTDRSLDRIVSYLITLQYMSILAGFACAIMSRREEKSRYERWAFIINILLFIALGGYFIGSYYAKS